MKKRTGLLFVLLMVFTLCHFSRVNAEQYSGPFPITPTITNHLADENAFTDSTWMYDAETRGTLSISLLLDAANERSIEFNNIDIIGKSFVYKKGEMLYVLYQGQNEYNNKAILFMHIPKDRDAAYTVYNLDEDNITMELLTLALANDSDVYYENDQAKMLDLLISIAKKE